MDQPRWRHRHELPPRTAFNIGTADQFAEDMVKGQHYFTLLNANRGKYFFGPYRTRAHAERQFTLWSDPELPEWKLKEIAATMVNTASAVEGHETWQCENCGIQWTSEVDNTPMKNGLPYDRTKDMSGWPVLCDRCQPKKET